MNSAHAPTAKTAASNRLMNHARISKPSHRNGEHAPATPSRANLAGKVEL